MAWNLRKVTIFSLLIPSQRESSGSGNEKFGKGQKVGREMIQGKVSCAMRKHSLR